MKYRGGDRLGYKVKWVEDNLGVSRKALRGFEEAGLMPKNADGQHREYTEEDVDRIWAIRVFQGMGYTLKEIFQLENDENIDFESSLAKKILELEAEKQEKERHLGYAKTIKLTGRFPARPRTMGNVKFEDFQEKALQDWNMATDPQAAELLQLSEMLLSTPPEEWGNTALARAFSAFEQFQDVDPDILLATKAFPGAIAKRVAKGASHPEVQLLVNMMYEGQKESFLRDMTVQEFAKSYATGFLVGDMAKLQARELSEKERLFIADAIAIFAGYDNYEMLAIKEYGYGE